eukprot:Hpha_TRINITY_DN15825_c0_g2::TRINITY_DN15825_c0_g2_i6::g.188557::m.188557
MAEKRKRSEEGSPLRSEEGSPPRSETGGIILFARVDLACAASVDIAEQLTPVEVQTDATVGDIVEELKKVGAVCAHADVDIEFQRSRLRRGELLADVGLCPQSVVCVLPSRIFRRRFAAGHKHSILIDARGALKCSGLARYATDVVPPAVDSRVVDVAAGTHHNTALLQDGSVVCWGVQKDDRCNVPMRCRRGGAARAVQVSAFRLLNAALLEDGEVECWGWPEIRRSGGPLGAACVQVCVGGCFVLLLLEDGTVRLWDTEACYLP